MAEREQKIKFSGDSSGIRKSAEDVKKSIGQIKNVAEGLKSGFQAFAAGKGLAEDMTEALNGNAAAIASVAGNLGNMAAAIAMAFKVHPIVAAVTTIISISSVIFSFWQKNKKLAEEAIKKNDDYIASLSRLSSELQDLMDKTSQDAGKDSLNTQLKDIEANADIAVNKLKQLRDAAGITEEDKILIDVKINGEELYALQSKIDALKKYADNKLGSLQLKISGSSNIFSSVESMIEFKKELEDMVDGGAIPEFREELFNLNDMTLDNVKKEFSEIIRAAIDAKNAFGDVTDAQRTLNVAMSDVPKVGSDDKPKNQKIDFPQPMEIPTDELRKIGLITGNVSPIGKVLSVYETKSIQTMTQIAANTKQTVDAIKSLDNGNTNFNMS